MKPEATKILCELFNRQRGNAAAESCELWPRFSVCSWFSVDPYDQKTQMRFHRAVNSLARSGLIDRYAPECRVMHLRLTKRGLFRAALLTLAASISARGRPMSVYEAKDDHAMLIGRGGINPIHVFVQADGSWRVRDTAFQYSARPDQLEDIARQATGESRFESFPNMILCAKAE